MRGSLAGWGQRTNALTTMGTDVSGNNPKDPLTQRQPNPVRGIPSPCKKALFLKVIGKPPLTHVYKHELALSNLATPQRFLEGAVRLLTAQTVRKASYGVYIYTIRDPPEKCPLCIRGLTYVMTFWDLQRTIIFISVS